MKTLTRILLSLTTALTLFLILVMLMCVGSVILPSHLAFFSGIDETPLFLWLLREGTLRLTWWIYTLIVLLAFLSLSTIFCTAEALMKRLPRQKLFVRLSPQIIHLGVLLVLFGHLLTASIGEKRDLQFRENERITVLDTTAITVSDISAQTDPNGYFTDWEVRLTWTDEGRESEERRLKPSHPLYFNQLGAYLQSVNLEPTASATIRIARDPGAPFALLGGILFLIGGAGIISGRLVK